MDDKRLYIYNALNRNKDEKINNILLYFIRSNDVNFSENKNGFFLNLSTLEDEYINIIYDLIKNFEIYEVNEIQNEDEIYEDSDDTNGEDINSDEELIFSDNDMSLIEYTKTI